MCTKIWLCLSMALKEQKSKGTAFLDHLVFRLHKKFLFTYTSAALSSDLSHTQNVPAAVGIMEGKEANISHWRGRLWAGEVT